MKVKVIKGNMHIKLGAVCEFVKYDKLSDALTMTVVRPNVEDLMPFGIHAPNWIDNGVIGLTSDKFEVVEE